jgi:UDP-N-acetylglucosamine diphosphorylase/glucosamine-1-phosphate N-acetyltransferase
MRYVIFDDNKWENFFPLTLTRSTGDLRVGILKLRQRICAYLEIEQADLIVSHTLQEIYMERHPNWHINTLSEEDTIFINSRLKINNDLVEAIKQLKEGSCLVYEQEVLAAHFKPAAGELISDQLNDLFKNLNVVEWKEAATWNYTWELITENSKYIELDFKDFFYDKDNYFETEIGITVLNPYNIWFGEGCSIMPGVVIDATEGPVVVDEGAKIMANAVIIGPVYIGKNSTIKVGSKIYEGTSIGPVCKVGGEVEESIFQAYSNKQHDGFLGHSYLGEWINIGADTNNSDLRNDYGQVPLYFYPKKKKVDTGCQYVGVVFGDHSKTGINCTINTGTVIGVGCNVVGSDMIMNHVRSFHWGFMKTLIEHELDKFIETATAVKNRRKLGLSEAEKELYSKIHKSVFEQN